MLPPPFPELDDLLQMIGDAGRRMSEIEACEGAAGNLSVCVRWDLDIQARFPQVQEVVLPQAVPDLVGTTFIVSGSGRRLREILDEPLANLGCLVVQAGGTTAELFTAPQRRFERVTSEFNSHLAVHADQVRMTGTDFHALVHAQPLRLTYLSHVPRYQETRALNLHLLRWQPETIVVLPEGIGFVPFEVPGSTRLMQATVEALRQHRLVVWARHGVMARSDSSIKHAADLIEYAEAAAKYEFLNLQCSELSTGLSPAEIREICAAFKVEQRIF